MYYYDCIYELIDVRNSCKTQTSVIYFLDELGLSLSDASKIADEKYIKGSELVSQKIKGAIDEVISDLRINLYSDDDTECDLDSLICDNSKKIAKAVYYKAAAMIYYELKNGTSRFNEYIKYKSEKIDEVILYLDSSYALIWKLGGGDGMPPSGKFQHEMLKLKPIQRKMESMCLKECVGVRQVITLP